MSDYLLALVCTLAVETPIVAALFAGQRRRMALACVAATTVTHVLLFWVVVRAFSSYEVFIFVGEVGVMVVEGLVYGVVSRPRSWARGIAASAAANASSFAVGMLWVSG